MVYERIYEFTVAYIMQKKTHHVNREEVMSPL